MFIFAVTTCQRVIDHNIKECNTDVSDVWSAVALQSVLSALCCPEGFPGWPVFCGMKD